MSNQTLEYLQQRIEESTYDLYDTISTIRKIKFAKFIDLVLFVTGLVFFGSYTIINQLVPNLYAFIAVPLFVAFYLLVRAILKGRTIGYLLMGIRFVNVRSKEQVSIPEFFNYIRKTTKLEVRYTELVRYYWIYDSRLNQNQPMKRFGMILVDTSKYKRFYRHYRDDLNRYNELVNQQA